MYLKRIELQGFKSFADKTVIDVHQGITGIVGPNGSGKSNISDAIRWVLGEQSAKALRGGKMEDVIFNGTQKRRPLGYAEVTMAFDNTTGFLASDYAEVEITRRVYRSGESEYLINRAPCRLRDIHELFMDTGMGRDGYSIVGQGKIAEIVSQKSEERRGVFEEAAGISKYRWRKQEAERKLDRTEDNLVRVRDILTELETRVEPLKRQSEKALKFLDLREELKGIEVSALLNIIETKRSQAEEAAEKYEIAVAQLEAVKAEHDGANAQSEALFRQVKEKDSEIDKAREELSRVEAQAAATENEKTLIENNINNTKENLLQIEARLESHGKHTDGLNAGITAEKTEKERLEERLKALRAEHEDAKERLAEATREMAARNNELEQAKNSAADLNRKKTEARTRLEGIDTLKQSYGARSSAIESEITEVRAEIANLAAEAAQIENDREAVAAECGELAAKLEKDSDGAAAASAEIQAKKDEYNRIISSIGEKRARLNMLKDMERSLEGYTRSVRELMNDHRSRKYRGSLVGVLSKLIKTDGKYITAVEVALGGAMQNIVVNDEADAKEAIEYLKTNRLGRVTFLPINTQKGRRLDNEARLMSRKGVVAVASDLVDCGPEIRNVVESLLGRTLVVDNIDTANTVARENGYRLKIVTLDGELLQPGGSITGGSINKSQALLRRAEEINVLEKDCAALDKSAENNEAEIDALNERLSKAREELELLRSGLSEAEKKLSGLDAAVQLKQGLIAAAGERIAKLEKEREELTVLTTGAEQDRDELNSLLNGSGNLASAAEELIRRRQEAFDRAVKDREAASKAVTDKFLEIGGTEKDVEISERRLEELSSSLESSEADYKQQVAAAEELRKKIEELTGQLEENRRAYAGQETAVSAAKTEVEARLTEKTGVNIKLDEMRDKIKSLSESIFSVQEETVRLETKKTRMENDLESASNRLWDDYELTYNTARPFKKEIGSITAANKRIGELKGQIRALGNINVDAIEEYKDVKQRYEFMTAQVSDLEEGKKNLEKLISEMMTVMKSQFREKFEMINKSFGEIFTELFGGGHAEVRLADPDDVLESGIEIEVQPPGKRLQSISLFSGGEHALTAIALLFALLKATPSPFIVLDEIEAALDEENVYRFAEYIRNYDKNTQFVLITHRRGTMEAADILYGVTMQEKGVSRLLSMNLDEIAADEEYN